MSLIDTPTNCNLHTIKFYIISKGSITILNPVAKLGIRSFIENRQEDEVTQELAEKSFFYGPIGQHHRAIYVGETVFLIYQREFNTSIWAVPYEVEVTSKSIIGGKIRTPLAIKLKKKVHLIKIVSSP